MKKEIKQETRVKRIADIISNSKFLNSSKYFKTNKVGVAAWDSWAAQGQAGGCGCCGVGHHEYTVYNKRNTSGKGVSPNYRSGSSWSSNPVSPNLCGACYTELEKQCAYEFAKW